MFRRKSMENNEPRKSGSKDAVKGATPRTHGATFAESKAAKAATVAVWVGLIVWPVITAKACAPTPKKVTTSTQSIEQPVERQQVGAAAEAYVSSWLRATSKNPADLSAYGDTASLRLPAAPFDARNLSVASVLTTGDALQVTVSAEIREATSTKTGTVVESWTPRFFLVTASTTEEGAVSFQGFPTPVPAPAGKTVKVPGFSQQITPGHPAVQAASAFLTAIYTGTGDSSRYASPGTAFTPISPSPYKTVSLISAAASEEAAEVPGDGAVVRVQLQVLLATADGRSSTADTVLELAGRAGRWEVSAMNPAAENSSPKKEN